MIGLVPSAAARMCQMLGVERVELQIRAAVAKARVRGLKIVHAWREFDCQSRIVGVCPVGAVTLDQDVEADDSGYVDPAASSLRLDAYDVWAIASGFDRSGIRSWMLRASSVAKIRPWYDLGERLRDLLEDV